MVLILVIVVSLCVQAYRIAVRRGLQISYNVGARHEARPPRRATSTRIMASSISVSLVCTLREIILTEINQQASAFKRGMHGAGRAAPGQEEPGAASQEPRVRSAQARARGAYGRGILVRHEPLRTAADGCRPATL